MRNSDVYKKKKYNVFSGLWETGCYNLFYYYIVASFFPKLNSSSNLIVKYLIFLINIRNAYVIILQSFLTTDTDLIKQKTIFLNYSTFVYKKKLISRAEGASNIWYEKITRRRREYNKASKAP
jgi:hypothetical protein